MKTAQLLTRIGARLTCAALAALLTAIPSLGQGLPGPPPVATLQGTVKSADGATLPGATVLAQPRAGGPPRPARADKNGKYVIPGLAPGEYHLTVTQTGFAGVAVETVLLENQTALLDFTLVPGAEPHPVASAPTKGKPRSVSEAGHHVHVTSKEELESRRAPTTTQALRRSSEVSNGETNALQVAPVVRGLSDARTAVVLDGERVTNQRVQVSPNAVQASQLEGVEVAGGGYSAQYGSGAIGGVVYMQTKQPTPSNSGQVFSVTLDGRYHSNGDVREGTTSFIYSTPKLALRASGSVFRQADYTAGDEAITIDEVLAVGRLYAQAGRDAAGWTVFSSEPEAVVPGSGGHGSFVQADMVFYPAPKHMLRYSETHSHHYDIGSPFTAPPFSTVDTFNAFRRFDKYALRYQGTGLSPLLASLSASVYGQKLALPYSYFNYGIVPGSSFVSVGPPPFGDVFTGAPSAFVLGNYSENSASARDVGVAASATLHPLAAKHKFALTAGYSFVHERSDDTIFLLVFDPAAVPPTAEGAADAHYVNNAGYANVEYGGLERVRLSGGIRVDNWRSEAEELQPGEPVPPVLETNNTYASPFAAAAVPFKSGLTPFVRWALSFREPTVEERYPTVLFANPTKANGSGDPALEPERSNSVDVGATFQRAFGKARVFATGSYFVNRVRNFNIQFGESPVPLKRQSGTMNSLNRVVIRGVTSYYSVNAPLFDVGSLSAFGSMTWMRGRNDTPLPALVGVVERLYNRPDTPIRLEGTAEDFPLGFIAPFTGVNGVRYTEPKGAFSLEYDLRTAARVTRIDPVTFYLGPQVSYGTFASMAPYAVHGLKGSYAFRSEPRNVTLSLGVDNLTNEFYWEDFVAAPSPGRSLTFGLTVELFNVLQR